MVDAKVLMRLRVGALFTQDAGMRLLAANEPDGGPAPEFFLGRTVDGSLCWLRRDVDDGLAADLHALCEAEPAGVDAEPNSVRDAPFIDRLSRDVAVTKIWTGPVFVVPTDLPGSSTAASAPQQETADEKRKESIVKSRRPSFLTVFTLVAVGCGEGGNQRPVVRMDSAGVEIVTSVVDDRPLGWEIERGISLGGHDDGPQSFFRVNVGLVGSDGQTNVYILDLQGYRVVVFRRDGTFVRSLGREGEGPGEFSSPGSLSVGQDGTVSVFDFGKGALVRFAPDGLPLPQLPLPFFPWPGASRHFETTSAGVLVASMLRSAPEGQFHHALRLIGPTDTAMLGGRRFPRPGMVRYPSCGGGLNLPRVFEMQLIWATNGERTVTVEMPAYELNVVEGTELMRKVRAGLPVRIATEALALAELGEGFRINFGGGPCTIPPREMVEGRGFAETVPWIDQVSVSPRNEIWVRRKDVGQEGAGSVDVFDETGAYLGSLRPNAPFPIVFLDANTFGAAETDDLDVSRLVIYNIIRQ